MLEGKFLPIVQKKHKDWVCIISKQRGTCNKKFANIICFLPLLQYMSYLLGKEPTKSNGP